MSLFPSKYHRKLLLTQLRTLGITSVIVSFSGSGDNGNVETPQCWGHDGPVSLTSGAGAAACIQWVTYHDDYDRHSGTWQRKATNKTMTLEEVLREITADALVQKGIDWYNNDGGQGELEIDFTASPPEIELRVGVNVTHVDEHNFNFSDEWIEDEPSTAE